MNNNNSLNEIKKRIWEKVKQFWLRPIILNKSLSEWTNPYINKNKFDSLTKKWYRKIRDYFL